VFCSATEACEMARKAEADVYLWLCPSLPAGVALPEGPLVLASQDIEATWARPSGYDIVTADSRQGAALAGQHLRTISCHRVAVLTAESERPVSMLRLEGFQAGWGKALSPRAIFYARRHWVEEGSRKASELLDIKPKPDGVFCTSDDLAFGLCSALIAHGVEPGRDIKVIGFDAQVRKSALRLTSVQAPFAEMGRSAVQMAQTRARAPRSVMRRLSLGCALRRGDTA